ncbi:MAG TPA: hypothetical protein PLE80_10615 [Opitutaceae bacterium]|nr:hypothetical protein [Opitutaceae bacterium]
MSLNEEVTRFRLWADKRLAGKLPSEEVFHFDSEWESDYPFWPDLYRAVETAVSSKDEVTTEGIELLLYVLARDNEDEVVLDILERYPSFVVEIASRARVFPDQDARWQFAVLLGRLDEADLLSPFLGDDDEYVRRRAGFALEEIRARKGSRPNKRPERNAGAASPSPSGPPPGVAHP